MYGLGQYERELGQYEVIVSFKYFCYRLVTFRLPARTDEYFYQEVGPEPTLIRGGYFVAGDDHTGPIEFSVMTPKGDVWFSIF